MLVPKHFWNSKEAFERIKKNEPVVLIECPLAYPAGLTWTFDSIANQMKDDFPCDIYVSDTKRFTYWDQSKNANSYKFRPPTSKVTMTFKEFLTQTRSESSDKFLYLQQALVTEMGPQLLQDFQKFSLPTAVILKQVGNWDEMTSNMMLCGKEGFISSVHFDEQQNLFAQLTGRKRVRLFSPYNWHRLYVHPNGHPCDRHSLFNLPSTPGSTVLDNSEDRYRYPAFATIEGEEMYVDLGPGEILFIPQYWFHQMEGLNDNVSLSWWFKHSTTSKGVDLTNINPSLISLIAVRRNLEKMLSDMVGAGVNAHMLFLSIASGVTPLPPWNVAPSSSAGSNPADINFTNLTLLPQDIAAGKEQLVDRFQPEVLERLVTHWKEIVQRALTFIAYIIKAELAPGFLLQMVSGRFSNVNYY